jgi:hypothetical protein
MMTAKTAVNHFVTGASRSCITDSTTSGISSGGGSGVVSGGGGDGAGVVVEGETAVSCSGWPHIRQRSAPGSITLSQWGHRIGSSGNSGGVADKSLIRKYGSSLVLESNLIWFQRRAVTNAV